MIYQVQFETTHMKSFNVSRGRHYWFESELSHHEFSDLIFSFEPMTMNLVVEISCYSTFSDCIIGSRDFGNTAKAPDEEFSEWLKYLRSKLVELEFESPFTPPSLMGTVICSDVPYEKMFQNDYDFSLTSEYFTVVDKYRTFQRAEVGASGLFETIVQNLDSIKDLAQIIYYFLAAAKIYRDLTAEDNTLPKEYNKNYKLARLHDLRLAVASAINVDFEKVHIEVFEARLHGPYMIVKTNVGRFQVEFDPNDELIQFSPCD